MPQPPQQRPPKPSDGPKHRHDQNTRSLDDIWPLYLQKGYFDEHGALQTDLLDRTQLTKLIDAVCSDLTTHQVRRFFGHCRFIEAALRGGRLTWPQALPKVRFLDVAAADAYGKTKDGGQPAPKIPRLFHDFIKANIAIIKTQQDFLDGFLPHFEAFVGFGSGKFSNKKGN